MSKMIEYRFRIALEKHQLNEALIEFMKSKENSAFSEKDKLWSAVSAYWLPFALRFAGCDDVESRQSAKNAIYRLKLHITYLAESFGLESEVSQPQSVINSLPVSKPKNPNSQVSNPSPPQQVNSTELMHQDDDTFDDLFN